MRLPSSSVFVFGLLSFAVAPSAGRADSAPPSVVVVLVPQAGAGKQWNGTATFTAGTAAGSVSLVLSFPDMMSIPEAAYPALLRPGTCVKATAGTRYPLAPVRNSRSATTLHAALAGITAKRASVEVRSGNGARVLACGSLPSR